MTDPNEEGVTYFCPECNTPLKHTVHYTKELLGNTKKPVLACCDKCKKHHAVIVACDNKGAITIKIAVLKPVDAYGKCIIKPCKFCGNTGAYIQRYDDYCIECPTCQCRGPMANDMISAIESWNSKSYEE